MSDLWILCEHAMAIEIPERWGKCEGGHKATVEEVVEWLKENDVDGWLRWGEPEEEAWLERRARSEDPLFPEDFQVGS